MKTNEKPLKGMYIFLLAISLLGVIIILVNTSKLGPGISHDSVAYIYAAKSLLNGDGYAYFGYTSPFIQWPPLFPTILAAANGIGMDVLTASRIINAIVFGWIIFFSGLWLLKNIRNKSPIDSAIRTPICDKYLMKFY